MSGGFLEQKCLLSRLPGIGPSWQPCFMLFSLVSELPMGEQKKWAAGLPDLAGAWVKQMKAKGLPGEQVMNTYMQKVRAAGEKPIRNWDK